MVRRTWTRVQAAFPPQRWARTVYLFTAACLLAAFYGVSASSIKAVPFLAPWLFGTACGLCLAAAIRPDRHAWVASLTATIAALAWRIFAIAETTLASGYADLVRLNLTEQERVTLLGLGLYGFTILAVVAVWSLWLDPRRWS